MTQQIRAIFENGLFRPLDPVALVEKDVVSLVVTSPDARSADDKTNGAPQTPGDDFDRELDQLLFDGPALPADFSRADVYADRA